MKLYRFRKHPADALVDDSQTLHRWKTSTGQLPMVDAKHSAELDHKAGEFEFINHYTRDRAEQDSHKKYSDPHHREAAIHHARGMMAANGSGDKEEAALHSAVFELHMNKLGEKTDGPTFPDWITEGMKNVKKNMADLPQWAQVKLLKMAVENLSKANEEAKPVSCPDCSGSGRHSETGDDCPKCEGWGTYLDWQPSPDPPPAAPVKATDFVPQTTAKVPLQSPVPPNWNNVDSLRNYFGDKVPADFDPKNARHFAALVASLDPDEREFLERTLFSHDRWRSREPRNLPPATGPSLGKAEVLHWWFEQLGEPVLQEVADLLKKDFIKLTLLKAAVIPFPVKRAQEAVVPPAERAGKVVGSIAPKPQAPAVDPRNNVHPMERAFQEMDDKSLIDTLRHYDRFPEDNLPVHGTPGSEKDFAAREFQKRSSAVGYKYAPNNQAKKLSFLHRIKNKFIKEEKNPQEERRVKDTDDFKGAPRRENDDPWRVTPSGYKPVQMKAEKKAKQYTGRDAGILASRKAPGAEGADKHGVGVHKDKKKEAAKNAARKWKVEE